jgi:hypothetical protein
MGGRRIGCVVATDTLATTCVCVFSDWGVYPLLGASAQPNSYNLNFRMSNEKTTNVDDTLDDFTTSSGCDVVMQSLSLFDLRRPPCLLI